MQHNLNQLKTKQLEQLSKDLMEQAQEVNQVSLIMQQFTQLQNNDLKLMVDHVKAKANQFVMVLVNLLQINR